MLLLPLLPLLPLLLLLLSLFRIKPIQMPENCIMFSWRMQTHTGITFFCAHSVCIGKDWIHQILMCLNLRKKCSTSQITRFFLVLSSNSNMNIEGWSLIFPNGNWQISKCVEPFVVVGGVLVVSIGYRLKCTAKSFQFQFTNDQRTQTQTRMERKRIFFCT